MAPVLFVVLLGLLVPSNGGLLGTGNANFNWAGYSVFARDNNRTSFTQVEGSWTVPVVDVPGATTKLTSVWVGLGTGDLTQAHQVLWQGGTERLPDVQEYGPLDQGGIVPAVFLGGQYSFWFEDFGCQVPCPNQGRPVFVPRPLVQGGDRVHVKINSLLGTAFFKNLTTGEEALYTISIDNTGTGSSAEWITEQAGDCDLGRCSYTSFSDPGFTDTYAYGTRLSAYLDVFRYRRFDLSDERSGLLLARPSGVHKSTHGFSTFRGLRS